MRWKPSKERILGLLVGGVILGAGALALAGVPELNRKGYRTPDLSEYEPVWTVPHDATAAVEGPETTIQVYEDPAGNQILVFTTGKVVWAIASVPKARPLTGYLLRSPECNELFTERWPVTEPITAPDCALVE